jgi:hypothetical protein
VAVPGTVSLCRLVPAGATIRDPVPVGIIPETGDPMTVTLFDEIGAKAIGVHGATGSGKSTLLNDVRERVTAMPDAALVQINGAHMGDELTWEPLAAATACGPAASDEEVRDKILAVLEWAQGLVTERSATLAESGHSVFQPTPEDPAIVLMIDEVDEVVASVPGSGPILEFLASKQRKSAGWHCPKVSGLMRSGVWFPWAGHGLAAGWSRWRTGCSGP